MVTFVLCKNDLSYFVLLGGWYVAKIKALFGLDLAMKIYPGY